MMNRCYAFDSLVCREVTAAALFYLFSTTSRQLVTVNGTGVAWKKEVGMFKKRIKTGFVFGPVY
jgi:hypothetical protein